MRTLIIFLFITLFSQVTLASEQWACSGFLATGDGGQSRPFLMTGDGDRYKFKGRFSQYTLKRVARAPISEYDIYVDDGTSTHKTSYYIRTRENTMEISQFHWDMKRFTTECFRQ